MLYADFYVLCCTCCVIRPAKHASELQCRYTVIFIHLFLFPLLSSMHPLPFLPLVVVWRWVRPCNGIHQWAVSEKQRATTVPHQLTPLLCQEFELRASCLLCICAPQSDKKREFCQRKHSQRDYLKWNWKPFCWKMNSNLCIKSPPQISASFASLIREECEAWISKQNHAQLPLLLRIHRRG